MSFIRTNDYRSFIGLHRASDWAVIAHCKNEKFKHSGGQSPAEYINGNLIEISGDSSGKLISVDEKTTVTWGRFDESVIFLMDSPTNNPYMHSVLENYGRYMMGGFVNIQRDKSASSIKEKVHINLETLESDKTNSMDLFDEFTDYLLIMRLPGFFHGIKVVETSYPRIDKNKVVWLIVGLHSKASFAGAMAFSPGNIKHLITYLRDQCAGEIQEYFEAVFEVPAKPERISDFRFLKSIYYKTLRAKDELGKSDELRSDVAVSFLVRKQWKEIPITTVQLDPVAACNFNCPTCIEKATKQKGLYLSVDFCRKILRDIREVGCKDLNFYGGEPTLHPDLDKIIGLSSSMGFNMLLVTNGSRLGEEKISTAIVDARNRIHIRLSINAHSAYSHRVNHGLSENINYFESICQSTLGLIERGVSVTISYLLFRNTINEIYGACKYWKRKGASALILRPLTGPQGKSPELGYSQVEKEIIKKVVKDNTDFVFVQPWFQNWLNGAKPPTIEHKEYATCYSGYYRIAISPYRSTRTSHRVTVDDVDMNMANSAWITLCTYRHYDASYGCEYPNNLKDWLHNDREVALARINPSFQCDGIICCRHEPNRRIFEQISIAGSK